MGSQRKSGIPTKYQPSAVERDHLGTSLSPRARLQTVLEHTAFTGKRTKGGFIRPCRARGSFAQFIPTRSLHVHTRKQRGHNTLNPQLPRACTAPKALTEPSPNPRLPVYDAQLSRNSRYSHSSPPSSGKSVQCTALRTRSLDLVHTTQVELARLSLGVVHPDLFVVPLAMGGVLAPPSLHPRDVQVMHLI